MLFTVVIRFFVVGAYAREGGPGLAEAGPDGRGRQAALVDGDRRAALNKHILGALLRAAEDRSGGVSSERNSREV